MEDDDDDNVDMDEGPADGRVVTDKAVGILSPGAIADDPGRKDVVDDNVALFGEDDCCRP